MSICIQKSGIIIGEYNINNGLVHSVGLMPAVEDIFKRLDFDKKNLDMLAVCSGPGSFTGIRIGIATANAMSIALQIPVVDVVSLDALSYNACLYSGYVIPTIDAQRGNYYTCLYSFVDGKFTKLRENSVKSYDEIFDFIDKSEKKAVVLGDISKDFDLPKNTVKVDDYMNFIKSSTVAALAKEKYEKGEYEEFAKPFYMRKSQAEVEYEKKHNH